MARICWYGQKGKDIAPPVVFYMFLTFNILPAEVIKDKLSVLNNS